MPKFSELPKHAREVMTYEVGDIIDEWLLKYCYEPSTALPFHTHRADLIEKLYDCEFLNTDTRQAIVEFAGKIIAQAEKCYDDDIVKIVKSLVVNIIKEYKL